MGQILFVNGHPKEFDRKFQDAGRPPLYDMQRGHKVMVDPGAPAMPDIYQRGDAFYYADLKLVDSEEHANRLPKPHREKALKQVAQLKKGGGKEAKAIRTKNSPDTIRPGTVKGAPAAGFLASRRQSVRKMSDLTPERMPEVE